MSTKEIEIIFEANDKIATWRKKFKYTSEDDLNKQLSKYCTEHECLRELLKKISKVGGKL